MHRIDLDHVTVNGSPYECLRYARTVELISVGLWPKGLEIHTRGADHWPHVDIENKPTWEDDQRATLWIFLEINGKVYASGCERLRPGQVNGDVKPMGDPNIPDTLAVLVGQGWLYDVNRWGAMAGYNPKPGEPVGFMLVNGSTRSDDRTPVDERSNWIVVKWPDRNGARPCEVIAREQDVDPAPAPVVIDPPPTVIDPPPTVVDPPPVPVAGLDARFNALDEKLDHVLGQLAALRSDANATFDRLANDLPNIIRQILFGRR